MNRRIYVKKLQSIGYELALRYFIPDVRDGLTLLERRLIYAIHEMKILPGPPDRKSITVISQAMSYVDRNEEKDLDLFYDALLWLVKGSDCKYPLVDGVGSFTEFDYDDDAIRRTFVKMTPYAVEMLKGLEKDAADFEIDEDGEKLCPKVLPGCFPYLLVHETLGQANDKIKTISQPLNLSEVIDAIIKVIDEPEITIEELSKIIKGPDYPFGGRYVRDENLLNAYTTGQGCATSRVLLTYDAKGNAIIATDIIWDGLDFNKEVGKIAEINGVSDVTCEFEGKEQKIVIKLCENADADKVKNGIYDKTILQAYWPINMYVLVDEKPEILNLREIIDQYLKHQKEVVTRKLQFDMKDDSLQVDERELLQIIKLELLDLKARLADERKTKIEAI